MVPGESGGGLYRCSYAHIIRCGAAVYGKNCLEWCSTVLNIRHPIGIQVQEAKAIVGVACSAAQAANASGVVASAELGADVVQFACEGRECELPLRIWATSVPHAFAQELLLVRTFLHK